MVLAGACFPPLLGLLFFFFASPSLASSSPALLTFDPPLSHPGKFEVTPPEVQDQSRYRFVKRQSASGGGEEEAALLALLDIVPRAARSTSDSLLVRLFTTLDLNEDGVIDTREFETVLRMVASLNRHPSFF